MSDFDVKETAAWRVLEAMEDACTKSAMGNYGNLKFGAGEVAELFDNAGRLAADGHIHGEGADETQGKWDQDTLMRLRHRRDLSLWTRHCASSISMLKQLNEMKSRFMRGPLDDELAAIFVAERFSADAAMNEQAQADDWNPEYEAAMQQTTAWGILNLLHRAATAHHAGIVDELGAMARTLANQADLQEEHLFTMRRHHLDQNVESYERLLRKLDAQDEWLQYIKTTKLQLSNDWDFTRGDTTFARTVFAPETIKPEAAPTP